MRNQSRPSALLRPKHLDLTMYQHHFKRSAKAAVWGSSESSCMCPRSKNCSELPFQKPSQTHHYSSAALQQSLQSLKILLAAVCLCCRQACKL